MARGESDDARVIVAFWSAVDLLRPLILAYVVYQYVNRLPQVEHPERGWVVLAVLGVWTALSFLRRHRGVVWFSLELAIGVAGVLASLLVDSRAVIEAGAPTMPGMWVAATVLSWAVLAGPLGGIGAAVLIAIADLVVIGVPTDTTIHNIVILLLLGALVGYCADLAREGQRALKDAAEVRAASAERERLARSVHDGVLQALSFVHRRGLEIGGEAADLGRLAAEQERALRELIRAPVVAAASESGSGSVTSAHAPEPGLVDLATLLAARAGERVIVVDTGEPVALEESRAKSIDAAVAAALDNVARHAGPSARAWVLLELDGDEVAVTVRDDGTGYAPGRLDDAAQEGRLGVSASILGRIRDLGGDADIASSSRGTLVQIRVPVSAPTRKVDS
ncbi:MAG: DUF5931 domain-containing protein [Mobilicoccus sp.]|nr:DUF5931 domain-containing protein [Mobilicoccus sp.]